jgi:hypothetical protein
MAKKRKKTLSTQAANKLRSAQHKSAVLDNLSFLCYLIGGSKLYDLLPQKYREVIYSTRGKIKVMSSTGKKIQKRLVEVMEKGLRDDLKYEPINVLKDSTATMSLWEFLEVGVPLYLMLNDERCYFHGKEQFECFYKDNNMRDLFLSELEKHIPLYCEFYSDLKRRILYDYRCEPKMYYDNYQDTAAKRFCVQIIIYPYELEVKPFKVRNETHLGTKLGRFYYNMRQDDWSNFYDATIAAKDLDPNTRFPELRMPVYIQQHAVERLMERTFCPFPNWVFSYLFSAVVQPKKVISRPGNRYLIEYYMVDIKIGYLLTELIDGELLIRTFLFITHNDTPEGEKLEALTGLQKEDRKYLSIDNLQTLANSDIEQNVAMHQIFLDAGLLPLLELCKRIREKDKNFEWLIDNSDNKSSLSNLISEYLKPGVDNDEYVEVEDTE